MNIPSIHSRPDLLQRLCMDAQDCHNERVSDCRLSSLSLQPRLPPSCPSDPTNNEMSKWTDGRGVEDDDAVMDRSDDDSIRR